jgi:hypothetical protein
LGGVPLSADPATGQFSVGGTNITPLSSALNFFYRMTTSATNPADAGFAFNSLNRSLVTKLYVSKQALAVVGQPYVDATTFFNYINTSGTSTNKGILTLNGLWGTDSYKVTGAMIDRGLWVEFPIVPISLMTYNNGYDLPYNQQAAFSFAAAGPDTGPAGPTGPTGPAGGPQGPQGPTGPSGVCECAPGAPNNSVQFNVSGTFYGSSNFIFDHNANNIFIGNTASTNVYANGEIWLGQEYNSDSSVYDQASRMRMGYSGISVQNTNAGWYIANNRSTNPYYGFTFYSDGQLILTNEESTLAQAMILGDSGYNAGIRNGTIFGISTLYDTSAPLVPSTGRESGWEPVLDLRSNSFFVRSIASRSTGNALYYNVTTGEITFAPGGYGYGSAGPQGPQGVAGPQGPQGPQGVTGAQGPQGSMGPQGPTGPQGVKGAQGPQGVSGPQGPSGPSGARGPQGPQGVTGAQGPSGPSGAAGPQGPQGVTGAQGPSGPSGYGAQGPQGVRGPTGPQGAQGPQGVVGAQGPTGPSGTGPTGPSGPVGVSGPSGPNGGPVGPSGPSGPPGGPTGPSGPSGTGPSGPSGPSGTRGPQGPSGVSGPTGPSGFGPTGPSGPAGVSGPSGPAGTGSYQITATTTDAGVNVTLTNLSTLATSNVKVANSDTIVVEYTSSAQFKPKARDLVYSATPTSTFTPDRNNGPIQKMTLTQNITAFNLPANMVAGDSITYIIKQDATGRRTVTFNSNYKFASGYKTLSTTANAIDMLNVFYDGSVYYVTLTTGYA